MKDISDFIKEYGEEGDYNLDPALLTDRQKLLNRCRERSLYLITDSEKTEKKLREKLKKSGKYDDSIIDETMGFLKQYGYLDDLRYAKQLILQLAGTKSLREIEQKLFQRGISQKDIKTAMEEYREEADSEEEELEAVRKLIRKKCRDISALEEEDKRKLYAALMRKGFSYGTVRRALQIEEEYD